MLAAIGKQSFSELALCSNDATIKILGFRQSGHGLFSTPATAQVSRSKTQRLSGTKGFVAYRGL
jgi:hypothetical protein